MNILCQPLLPRLASIQTRYIQYMQLDGASVETASCANSVLCSFSLQRIQFKYWDSLRTILYSSISVDSLQTTMVSSSSFSLIVNYSICQVCYSTCFSGFQQCRDHQLTAVKQLLHKLKKKKYSRAHQSKRELQSLLVCCWHGCCLYVYFVDPSQSSQLLNSIHWKTLLLSSQLLSMTDIRRTLRKEWLPFSSNVWRTARSNYKQKLAIFTSLGSLYCAFQTTDAVLS